VEHKIDRALALLNEIEASLRKPHQAWATRFFDTIEKLLIPLAVGALAYVASEAGNKISTAQLTLAQSTAEDRKSEFNRTIQAQYIELFYKDFTSSDTKRQASALRLLSVMEPGIANNLAKFAATSPDLSSNVRQDAESAQKQIEAVAPLYGFKIGIYYLSEDAAARNISTQIEQTLSQKGFRGPVQLYPRKPSFFEEYGASDKIEVRYESPTEDDAGEALYQLLQAGFTQSGLVKQVVSNRTPNFLSIFIPAQH
jgi:hypothetical protein